MRGFGYMNIKIDGNEKSKSEIIYNNIVDTMDEMKLSKDDQLDYLKQKISFMESEMKNRVMLVLTILIGIILVGFGIFFMISHFYLLGCTFIIVGFFFTTIKLLLVMRKMHAMYRDNKFDKVEQLRRMLNIKLK